MSSKKNCEYDLTWKLILCRYIQSKMRTYWIRVDPIQQDRCSDIVTGALTKGGILGQRYTQRKMAIRRQRQRSEQASANQRTPRTVSKHHQLETSVGDWQGNFRETPKFQIYDFQKWERINFSYFQATQFVVLCHNDFRNLIQEAASRNCTFSPFHYLDFKTINNLQSYQVLCNLYISG